MTAASGSTLTQHAIRVMPYTSSALALWEELFVVLILLKLPVAYVGYILWWSIKAVPEVGTEGGTEGMKWRPWPLRRPYLRNRKRGKDPDFLLHSRRRDTSKRSGLRIERRYSCPAPVAALPGDNPRSTVFITSSK